ncbi:hypothetical protein COZ41_01265 [Candidatus Shapirobacteria bacterium CG_4_10_14_3_um_filter_35_13]|uniref:GIY-YIG domain-containing protein n=1 Tax=Candidatus Shapirobacteria bacterium CG_4_10_14_3_um_filter_35_13 TaxID=1974873 RepID=A0A2M7LJ85_9BACT|nr:MAG: hypothetical protein COZ41_01265 [Candidatus Shapirobacteria bacterium CG_4_10_14_3_um_filter_35_13]
MYFVYFLQSLKNNKVYIGSTEKLPEIRLKEHDEGTNKFTRNNRPLKLVYFEKYFCKQDSTAREKFYKSGFGKMIKKIIIQTINNNAQFQPKADRPMAEVRVLH